MELLSVLSVFSQPEPTHSQDVTFLSIEEVTLHQKGVARQPPCSADFLFSEYDDLTVPDFSQHK